jgi:hypothetical protein
MTVARCAILCALALLPASAGCTADSQHLTFTAAGDYGFGPAADATLSLIPKSNAAFHLALGDFSYTPDRPPSAWCDFVHARVGREWPFLLLAGNHEDDFGGHGHVSEFASCLPDRIGVTGRYGVEYYFDHRNLVRIILLSPDLTIEGKHYYYGEGNDRLKWVAAAIDEARARQIPWVIVGMHKSCVSVGEYDCRLYADLWNLLIQKRVDMTLHGHEHSYQRSKQLATGPGCPAIPLNAFVPACVADDGSDDAYIKGAGTVSVIAGTAGADLYAMHADDSERGYVARWMGRNALPTHGLVRIRLSPTELSAAFVSSSGSGFEDKFVIDGRGSK